MSHGMDSSSSGSIHPETLTVPSDLFLTPEKTKMNFNLFPATEAFTNLKYVISAGGGDYFQEDSRGLKDGAENVIDVELIRELDHSKENVIAGDGFLSSRYIFESVAAKKLLDKSKLTMGYISARSNDESSNESADEGNIPPVSNPEQDSISALASLASVIETDEENILPKAEPQDRPTSVTSPSDIESADEGYIPPMTKPRSPRSQITVPIPAKKIIVEAEDGEVPTTSCQTTETNIKTRPPKHDPNFEWRQFKFNLKDLELKKLKEDAKESSKNSKASKGEKRTAGSSKSGDEILSGFETADEELVIIPPKKTSEKKKKNVPGPKCSKNPQKKGNDKNTEPDKRPRGQQPKDKSPSSSEEEIMTSKSKSKRTRDIISSTSEDESESNQSNGKRTRRSSPPRSARPIDRPDSKNKRSSNGSQFRGIADNKRKIFYTKADDIKMLKIIGASMWHANVFGNIIYKEMANQKSAFPERSFDSLNNRFRKAIFPNIGSYNLSGRELSLYDKGAEQKKRGANLATNPYNPNWRAYNLF